MSATFSKCFSLCLKPITVLGQHCWGFLMMFFSQKLWSLVVLAFMDLTAAFSTVDHQILLSHLESWVGIQGSALERFRSYLRKRGFVCPLELLSPPQCLSCAECLMVLFFGLFSSLCICFLCDQFTENRALLSIFMPLIAKSMFL